MALIHGRMVDSDLEDITHEELIEEMHQMRNDNDWFWWARMWSMIGYAAAHSLTFSDA